MTTPNAAALLPYSVGRFSVATWALGVVLLLVFGAGLVAYEHQHHYGEIVTGMRTVGRGGAVWALYIVFDMYFVSISAAGILAVALVRLFRIDGLRPLVRMAGLLTLVALPAAGMMVIADLGRPEQGLLYLPAYARPMSPFFGTFSLIVSGYLSASLVYFFLDGRADAWHYAQAGNPRWRWFYRLWASGYRDTPAQRRRHDKASFWLALATLPLMIVATSTLGFVFGIQGGRPGWHSALQAPGFVVMGSAAALGMLMTLAAILRGVLGLARELPDRTFRILSDFVWVLALLTVYLVAVEELTSFYAASESTGRVATEIVFGTYAVHFWVMVATLSFACAIGLWQFLSGTVHLTSLAIAGVLVSVAAVLKRYLIVVPSQTHGALLPYEPGHYAPTQVEYAVVAGVFAFAALLFLIAVRVFPIVPVTPPDAVVQPASVRETDRWILRRLLTGATLFGGLVVMGIGLALSLRFGTESYLDPVITYSPMIFVSGLVLAFLSAAVYEMAPLERREPQRGAS